jgi:hypothetical protein
MKLKDLNSFLCFDIFRDAVVVSQNQSLALEDYNYLEDVISTQYADYEIVDIYLSMADDFIIEIKE